MPSLARALRFCAASESTLVGNGLAHSSRLAGVSIRQINPEGWRHDMAYLVVSFPARLERGPARRTGRAGHRLSTPGAGG
jgi:hypothetical protein